MQPPSNIVDIYKQQGWNDEASIRADIAAGGWTSKVPQSTNTPASQPSYSAPSSVSPLSGGFNPDDLAKTLVERGGYNPIDAASAARGPRASELAKEFGVSTAGASGAFPGLTTQPTINLTDLYKSLYQGSGIADLEKELSAKEKEFTEAKGGVNENPFLAEASRVGKIAKLEELFQERTANLRSDLARKKADVETQLNLQLKQFDINSQQAQQALSQFNTLLGLGALTNASGEDIANIARSTGLSTSMIDAAIKATTEVEPQIMTTDTGFVLINPQTGDIIKSQTIPGKSGGGGGTVTERELSRFKELLVQDVKNGLTLSDAIALYRDTLDLADITRLYNQYSVYGPAQESATKIREIYESKPGKQTGGGGNIPSFSNNYGFSN